MSKLFIYIMFICVVLVCVSHFNSVKGYIHCVWHFLYYSYMRVNMNRKLSQINFTDKLCNTYVMASYVCQINIILCHNLILYSAITRSVIKSCYTFILSHQYRF